MIKLFLGTIIVLAVIGGAIAPKNYEDGWHIVISKQDPLDTVTNGAKRILNQFKKIYSDSDLSDISSIVIEEG